MVVGVMSDFYQESLYEPIKPLMLAFAPDNQRIFNIALAKNNDKTTIDQWTLAIAKIQNSFKEIYSTEDFTYDFQDETIVRNF